MKLYVRHTTAGVISNLRLTQVEVLQKFKHVLTIAQAHRMNNDLKNRGVFTTTLRQSATLVVYKHERRCDYA